MQTRGSRARKPKAVQSFSACEKRQIDVVITKSISRFARNTIDCLNYIRQLKALGVPVIFEKESINTMEASGEVPITILASIAQQESASISQNVKMGIRYIMREGRGRVNYSQFLGYTKGPAKGSLVIVPHEAEVVRCIYRQYLDGYSPALVARRLERDAVPTPTGGRRWHASTIVSILQNEKYCGDLLLQKYFTEDFLTHKIVKNEGQLPQYFVENHHDPIVPKEVFAQVQGERMRRAALKGAPSVLRFGSRKALEGRLVCAKCGRTLKHFVRTDEQRADWRCRSRATVVKSAAESPPDASCSLRIVPERLIQRSVLEAFNRLPEYRGMLVSWRRCLREREFRQLDEQLARVAALQQQLDEHLEELALQAEQDDALLAAALEVRDQQAEARRAKELRLRAKVARLATQRQDLTMERAAVANRDMQLYNLLELVDQMTPQPREPQPAGLQSVPAGEDPALESACSSTDDFLRRTEYRVPVGTFDAGGRMARFSDEVITRYLDKVLVYEHHLEVHFKAGLRVCL